MAFRISDLARGIRFRVDGEVCLAVRRPYPLGERQATRTFRLRRPMTLIQLSWDLYQSTEAWALLAEWNGIPNPGRFIARTYLPRGYEIRYLPLDVYQELLALRQPPNLAQAGTATVGVSAESINVPMVSDPNAETFEQLLISDPDFVYRKTFTLT